MLKYISTLVFLSTVFTTYASPKVKMDTAVMFFTSRGNTVRTLDSADYYMLILPPDASDNRFNIQEFYRDGKVKMIGKGDPSANSMKTGSVLLDGDCISYYHSGGKSANTRYNKGYKDGPEYFYYPNGKNYCQVRHKLGASAIYDQTLYWDCYDSNGNIICQNGNGKWVSYDDSCKNIRLEGQVVNGYMEGEWTGRIILPDTIRYIYKYKHGLISSSIAYDKNISHILSPKNTSALCIEVVW